MMHFSTEPATISITTSPSIAVMAGNTVELNCSISLHISRAYYMLDPHMTYNEDPQSLVIILIPMIRCHMTLIESDEVVEICINAAGANTDCPSYWPKK